MSDSAKIRIYYPTAGPVRVEFVHSLALLRESHIAHLFRWPPTNVLSGPDLASSRNKATQYFYDHETEPYILWLDDDMIFNPETIESMIAMSVANDHPLVSGLYFGNKTESSVNDDGQLVQYTRVIPVAYNRSPDGGYLPIELDYTDGEPEPFEVDGVGAGCLLIHRSLLKSMGGKDFWTHLENLGEDLSFCKRAKYQKVRPLLVPRARCGHVKQQIITVDQYLGAPVRVHN